METVGVFITEQLLKMDWLSHAVSYILVELGIDISSHIGVTLQFFFYDVIKITILLCVLIFVISLVQTYFPPERTRAILSRFPGIAGNTLGALLGTVTPFCSCSSIPIFIGFTRAGLPLGVTFSFLISSPMVDLGSLVLILSIFGAHVALVYTIAGLLIAIVGGSIISHAHMESELKDIARGEALPMRDVALPTWRMRLASALGSTRRTFKKVFPYILVGVGIGALIHNWIPQQIIETLLVNNPLAVPLATVVGAPIYADIFGAIPIAEALFSKGVGLGTILAFMMSVTTVSIPSLTMLSQAIKPKLMGVFLTVCLSGMMICGILFNALQPFVA